MSVAVARSVNILGTKDECNEAMNNRMAAHRRTQELAVKSNFQDTREASKTGTIYGSAEHVGNEIQALHDPGIEYVLLNWPAGISTLRRFSKDMMPSFRWGQIHGS